MYDSIGNLIRDSSEAIRLSVGGIKWNVYGKITEINKVDSSSTIFNIGRYRKISYYYDASGNRVGAKYERYASRPTYFTWYVRDASGNVMAVYSYTDSLRLTEQHLYGSSRLGTFNPNINMQRAEPSGVNMPLLGSTGKTFNFIRGLKFFELSNHLGNVLVTLSDKKKGIQNGTTGTVLYYLPIVKSAQDYYPFGMMMPGRKFSSTTNYRYGFNGKEEDDEVKGDGNQQDYGMRIYDGRLGRFLSVDPLIAKYPWYSPYHFAGNNPIKYIDLDGGEPKDPASNYQYNDMGNAKSLYGGEIELNDPVLGRITVRMVNDVTTKQSWFVTKVPNTNQYMYYQASDGNHQTMHIQKNKGELSTVGGGQFLPYQTPEQIEDARRIRVNGEFVDAFSTIYVGILSLGAALPAMSFAGGGSLLTVNPLTGLGAAKATIGGVSDLVTQLAIDPEAPINWFSVGTNAIFANPFTASATSSALSVDKNLNVKVGDAQSIILNTIIGGTVGAVTDKFLVPYAPKKFTTPTDNVGRTMTNTIFNFMTAMPATGTTNAATLNQNSTNASNGNVEKKR